MCETCKQIVSQLTPIQISTLEKLSVEAEAFGQKILKELTDCGFIAMRPDSFSPEQIAAGVSHRAQGVFALAAISGYSCAAAIHDESILFNSEDIFEGSAKVGWAVGFHNQSVPRH